MNAFVKKFLKEFKEEKDRIHLFQSSGRFYEVLDEIFQHIEFLGHSLDCESILYFEKDYPFTYREYQDVFSILRQSRDWKEESLEFPTLTYRLHRVDWEETYQFTVIHGQGLASIVSKL